jgi:hypothetical protein
MAIRKQDSGLDELLALDGVVLVVDPVGKHWVKFVVKRVPPSEERPHGVSYSLTLHAADGKRLVGFDNAHAISTGSGPSKRTSAVHDHRHRHDTTKPYEYSDAATLLRDFWNDVDAVLHERGVNP